MQEWLMRNAWETAGAFIGLLAILVSYVLYRLQQQRKELAFGVIQNFPLLTVSEVVEGRIQIQFDSQRISNLRALIIGLKNSGTSPITVEDFSAPFKIMLGEGVSLLSAEITKQYPENLDAQVVRSSEALELSPVLLNPGDWILIKVLTTGRNVRVKPVSRIVGISNHKELNRGVRASLGELRNLAVNAGLFSIIGLGLWMLGYFDVVDKEFAKMGLASFGLIVFGLLLLSVRWLIGVVSNNSNRYIDDPEAFEEAQARFDDLRSEFPPRGGGLF